MSTLTIIKISIAVSLSLLALFTLVAMFLPLNDLLVHYLYETPKVILVAAMAVAATYFIKNF